RLTRCETRALRPGMPPFHRRSGSTAVSFVNRVGLCRHDEIVSVQVLDLVRPPRDPHPAPIGRQTRKLALGLCSRSDLIGERERLLEVAEAESTIELRNAVLRDDAPLRNFRLQLGDLLRRHRRGAYTASLALLFGQFFHAMPPAISLRRRSRR